MAERLIWRPNGIPPERWEAMSRADQIRWWKGRQPTPEPPAHPLRAVRLYHEGAITAVEFSSFVFERLAESNVAEFLSGCPTDLLGLLRDAGRRLPPDGDEQAWGEMVTFAMGCYPPWVTVEDIRCARDERQRAFREGLRVFRRAAGEGDGPHVPNPH